MKKLVRSAMLLLGENLRLKIYRKMANVPAESLNPKITIEVAATQSDLQQAYSLLHDCYVGIKIIDPKPSGLRCNLFSFLPTTVTVVAKLDNRVIGTVSLIRDSVHGLPSDKEFLEENNILRKQQRTLIEVSALAVCPSHRTAQHSISLLLMKYLYNFSKRSFQANNLIAIVHPKAEDFYKALWQFKRNGKEIQYNTLNKARGIHLSMDLSDEHLARITDAFGKKDPMTNLPFFVQQEDPRFKYPEVKNGKSIHPVLTPNLVNYFCSKFPDIWSGLAPIEQNTVLQVYSTYFGISAIRQLKSQLPTSYVHKDFRTPLKIQCLLQAENNAAFGSVTDLSSGGCFMSMNELLLPLNSEVKISFKFDGKLYHIKGQIAWTNYEPTAFHQTGVGIKFTEPVAELNGRLQQWLYSGIEETAALEDISPLQLLGRVN